MPYIQTSTMFWMRGGGFPAEICDSEDDGAIYCGPGSQYKYLKPLDLEAFREWIRAGKPEDRESLLKAGWVPAEDAH